MGKVISEVGEPSFDSTSAIAYLMLRDSCLVVCVSLPPDTHYLARNVRPPHQITIALVPIGKNVWHITSYQYLSTNIPYCSRAYKALKAHPTKRPPSILF